VVRVVISDANGIENDAEVAVTVRTATVVALVDGGSERVVSAADALVLDASESYDPDVPPGEPADLEFVWTCQGEACPELEAGSAVQRLDGVAAGARKGRLQGTCNLSV